MYSSIVATTARRAAGSVANSLAWVGGARGVHSSTTSPAAAAAAAAAAARIGPYPSTASGAKNVGILALETYFPTRYVDQEDLEKFDGVGEGKYRVGLGQKAMAFVDDREDVNSVCLTAVNRLLKNYDIDPASVGRVEVGTESIVDKSKSTKTTLMQLFPGNPRIEGCTSINACYGGTASLLNSIAWVESSEWDGRYAIVVAADIAVYEAGPARPTGGVGAVACLVGPDAPLKVVPRTRATHSVDAYDFYKPALSSEYPKVDGKLSQVCYLEAVDACYNENMDRLQALRPAGSGLMGVSDAYDHLVFHSPYNKLVQQSFARLIFNDVCRFYESGLPVPEAYKDLIEFAKMPRQDTYTNRDLDKALKSVSPELYQAMVAPSASFSQSIGNSYTAAVFANLLCLVSNEFEDLPGKRIGMFSYGSGAIATMYSLDAAEKGESGEFTVERMAKTVNLQKRLDSRRAVDVSEFLEAIDMREKSYGRSDFMPAGSLENLAPGTFFLDSVDSNHVRMYNQA